MTDVTPPWIAYPNQPPFAFFWREAGEPWLNEVWLPFWRSLGDSEKQAYLKRRPPPQEWLDYLLADPADDELARIDAEDIASGALTPTGRAAQAKTPPRRKTWLERIRGK